MQSMIDTSRWLCGPLTVTLEALRAGEITLAHARIIVDAAEQLPAGDAGRVPGPGAGARRDARTCR